jgi:hypothetical protein
LFFVLPVVSLADSLHHRLQILQAFGLLSSFLWLRYASPPEFFTPALA